MGFRVQGSGKYCCLSLIALIFLCFAPLLSNMGLKAYTARPRFATTKAGRVWAQIWKKLGWVYDL